MDLKKNPKNKKHPNSLNPKIFCYLLQSWISLKKHYLCSLHLLTSLSLFNPLRSDSCPHHSGEHFFFPKLSGAFIRGDNSIPPLSVGLNSEFFFYLPGQSFSGSSWDSINPKLNLQVLVILYAPSRLKFLSHVMGSWVFWLKILLMCAALQIGPLWTQVSRMAGRLSYLSHNGRPPSFEIPYTGINIRYLFFSFWLTSHCI